MDYYDRYESFRSDGNISIVPFIEIDVSATDINITFNKSTMRMDTLSYKYYGLSCKQTLNMVQWNFQYLTVFLCEYHIHLVLLRQDTKKVFKNSKMRILNFF